MSLNRVHIISVVLLTVAINNVAKSGVNMGTEPNYKKQLAITIKIVIAQWEWSTRKKVQCGFLLLQILLKFSAMIL